MRALLLNDCSGLPICIRALVARLLWAVTSSVFSPVATASRALFCTLPPVREALMLLAGTAADVVFLRIGTFPLGGFAAPLPPLPLRRMPPDLEPEAMAIFDATPPPPDGGGCPLHF